MPTKSQTSNSLSSTIYIAGYLIVLHHLSLLMNSNGYLNFLTPNVYRKFQVHWGVHWPVLFAVTGASWIRLFGNS